MADQEFETIVIGSGPGGLATAALLAFRGVKTLLLEKNNVLGGKMFSVDAGGYAYDLFPHGQVPLRGSAFEEIFEELGIADEYQPSIEADDPRDMITLGYRRHDWDEYRIQAQRQAMDDPEPFFKLWDATEQDKADAIAVMTEIVMMTPEDISKLDDLTMQEWLSQRPVPDGLFNYMGLHANASLAEPLDLVAASEQITILQQIMVSGGGGQYKGGFAHLTHLLSREFEKHGGTVVTGAKVKQITVERGAVTGVETEDATYKSSVVVSSAGIQPTILKLVGEDKFDHTYTDYVRNLVPGWAFTSVRYFLSEEVMKTGLYTVWSDDSWLNTERFLKQKQGVDATDEVVLFGVNHKFFDENAAPPGKQVLVIGTPCSSNPEAEEIEGLHKVLDNMMEKLFPEIMAVVERKEYSGPADISRLTRDSVVPGQGGECVGVAQIVGQCGKYKPNQQTPIRGLILAGADAGAAGMGTHQAALSGRGAARLAELTLNKIHHAL